METRFALVTGTSSGLGEALVRTLLAESFTIVGIARRPASVEAPGYHHVTLDLADLSAVASYFSGPFLERHHPPSYARVALVNNAGTINPVAILPAIGLPDLARALALHVAVPAWLMGLLADRCPASRLRVVNIGSGAATNAYPGWGAYCMGKAALRIAGQVLAVEADEAPALAGRDIAVVSYAPGVLDTPMQADVRASPTDQFPRIQKFLDLKAKGALVDPALPAAEICRLLLSDDLPRWSEIRYGA